MYKYVIPAFLFLSIASCNSDDQETLDAFIDVIELFEKDEDKDGGVTIGTNSQGEDTNSGVVSASGNELRNIAGVGETVTISSENKTDLTVIGSNNSVNIETNLGELRVDGSNNLLRFSSNISVDSCTVSGSDNSAEKDESVFIDCEINGSGNMGF